MLDKIKANIKGKDIRIVFTEGMDDRIVKACRQLKDDNLLQPVIIGTETELAEAAKKAGVSTEGLEVIDPKNYEGFDALVKEAIELRKGKWTEEETIKLLSQYNYFGTMLVANGNCHGLIGGATYSTADTIRPAFQLVKTKNGATASSYFVMKKDDDVLFFADCAINPNPTSEQLAEIAEQTAVSAKGWGFTPKVAMLSYSTKGSGIGPDVEKVEKACEILEANKVDFEWDGTLQLDSAVDPKTGKKKAPDSKVAGQANVLVFPDLNSGNIGYKIAQRLGGYEAIGPVLQGLNKPLNDLSRGCSWEDVYNVAIITANQE